MKQVILSSLMVLAASTSAGCQALEDDPLEILIPLYIYPSHYQAETYVWPAVAAAQEQVSVTAIINPNNGPNGGPPNQDYVQGMQDLRAAGVELVGYVSTQYGKRSIEEVKADIDIYATSYPVSGIFLDEAASGVEQIKYYQQLYHYIQGYSSLNQTILNQGTSPDPAYLNQATGDTFVVFENNALAWQIHQFPAYLSEARAKQLAVMVYAASSPADMRAIATRARQQNISYIFITDDRIDDADGNPWNQLPSYWTEEIATLRTLNEVFASSSQQ